jgi:hypothetical protein
MILCARYWRDQCHGGIPSCCASVLYTAEHSTLVGAIDGIFIVLIFLWFYNFVHQFGTIKKCFDTVDARYKHEERNVLKYKKNSLAANSTYTCSHVFITWCLVKADTFINFTSSIFIQYISRFLSHKQQKRTAVAFLRLAQQQPPHTKQRLF